MAVSLFDTLRPCVQYNNTTMWWCEAMETMTEGKETWSWLILWLICGSCGVDHSDLLPEGWRVHTYVITSPALLFQGTQPMTEHHKHVRITCTYPTRGSSNRQCLFRESSLAWLRPSQNCSELGFPPDWPIFLLQSLQRSDSSPVCKSLPSPSSSPFILHQHFPSLF